MDLFNKGYKDAAIIFYEQVVKLEAFDLETCFNKAFSLSVLERHTEAIYFYDLVIKLNPTDAEAYVHKGVALSNLGYYEDAIRQYDQAIKIGVKDTEAYYCKNKALTSLGRIDEANYYLQLTHAIELDSSISNSDVGCENYFMPILGGSAFID